jgi:hypothetical protein
MVPFPSLAIDRLVMYLSPPLAFEGFGFGFFRAPGPFPDLDSVT